MTNADRSTGHAYGFAPMLASGGRSERSISAGKGKPRVVIGGRAAGLVPASVEPEAKPAVKPFDNEPHPAARSTEEQKALTAEEELHLPPSRQEPHVEPPAPRREPSLWLAISLAGLTYAFGVAGLWSVYRTFDLIQ